MKLCVMIVEDEPLIALDLEEIIKAAGHGIAGIAATMQEALGIASTQPIDVAIMDVDLAYGPDGVETAMHLRQRYNVGSLFVSSNLDEEVRAMALEWRPIGFIGKPFQEKQIVEALAKVA